MGRHNHENSVAIPGYGKPVVLSGDDSFVSNPAHHSSTRTSPTTRRRLGRRGRPLGVRADDRRRRLLRLPDRLAMSVSGRSSRCRRTSPRARRRRQRADGGGQGLSAAAEQRHLAARSRTASASTARSGCSSTGATRRRSPSSSSSASRTSPTTGGPACRTSSTSPTAAAGASRPAGRQSRSRSSNGRIWKLVLDPSDPTKVLSLLDPDRRRRRPGQGSRRDPPARQHRVDGEQPPIHRGSGLEPAVPGRLDRPGCDDGADLAVRPRDRHEPRGREGQPVGRRRRRGRGRCAARQPGRLGVERHRRRLGRRSARERSSSTSRRARS